MIAEHDLQHCRDAIRTGSLSFHAASKLLPRSVRDPALALYAFCRLADDEVDEGSHKARAVLDLQERLDLAYAGRPRNAPEDRAFAAIVETFEMPRALPEALLEGLAWDAEERRYASLSDVRAYSARVASAVGAMMCVLMRVRDADALARACDLGVAMQLTNIARDVGEDARAGRVYLPTDWLAEADMQEADLFAATQADPAVRQMTHRLLREADRLYRRSEAGINALPRRARPGIWAARLIYDAIGGALRKQGYDSVTMRAHTGRWRKLALVGKAGAMTAAGSVMPRAAEIYAPPLDEVRFLVDAAATGRRQDARPAAVIRILSDLKSRDVGPGQPQV